MTADRGPSTVGERLERLEVWRASLAWAVLGVAGCGACVWIVVDRLVDRVTALEAESEQ